MDYWITWWSSKCILGFKEHVLALVRIGWFGSREGGCVGGVEGVCDWVVIDGGVVLMEVSIGVAEIELMRVFEGVVRVGFSNVRSSERVEDDVRKW